MTHRAVLKTLLLIGLLFHNFSFTDAIAQSGSGNSYCNQLLNEQITAGWTSNELEVSRQLCLGLHVDMRSIGQGDELNCQPAEIDGEVPENRVIRGDILKRILVANLSPDTEVDPKFNLQCAQITGEFDLSDYTIRRHVSISSSAFLENVNLDRTHFESDLNFWETQFLGEFHAERLRGDHSVLIWETHLENGILMRGARIEGQLNFDGATSGGDMNIDSMSVGDSLFLREMPQVQTILLRGTKIGENLETSESKFVGKVEADDLTIGGNAHLSNTSFVGIVLSGAKVDGDIDFGESIISGHLDIDGMNVDGSLFLREMPQVQTVFLRGTKIGGNFETSESKFVGKIEADDLTIGGNAHLSNTSFMGIDLSGAKVDGDIDFGESIISGHLEIDSMSIGDSLFLRKMPQVQTVLLRGTKIGGNLETIDSIFNGKVEADNLKIGGNAYLYDTSFMGVDLYGSKISGELNLVSSTISGNFDAVRMEVGGNFLLQDSPGFNSISLTGARIGGTLDGDGSTFNGQVDADSMDVGGSFFLRNCPNVASMKLRSTHVGGNLETVDSKFNEKLTADNIVIDGNAYLYYTSFHAVDLRSANIANDLDISGSKFGGPLNLSSAHVLGELTLSNKQLDGPEWVELRPSELSLNLQNAKIGVLQAEKQAWEIDGQFIRFNIQGFAYDKLGGSNADLQNNMANASSDWLVSWIESQPGHQDYYSPQSYATLSDRLLALGSDDRAKAVTYAKYEQKRTAMDTGFWESFWLQWRRLFIGHGVYPFLTLVWAAIFLGAGWFIANQFSLNRALNSMGGSFWYSFGKTLPLIELHEDHKKVDHGKGWVNGYFYFQIAVCFVLATVLVGALTLLGE